MDGRLFTDVKELNSFTLIPLASLDIPYAVMAPGHVGMRDIPVEEVPGVFISRIEAVWDARAREYVTTTFNVTNRGDTRIPVNGTLLRRIPVDKYRNLAIRKWLLRYKGNNECEPFNLDSLLETFRSAPNEGPTDSRLKYVSIIYALSKYTGNAPRKAVADAFGISARTATNWINLAQDHGYPIPRQL